MKTNCLARLNKEYKESVFQMHNFGNLCIDLGKFWRDLGMRNHSVYNYSVEPSIQNDIRGFGSSCLLGYYWVGARINSLSNCLWYISDHFKLVSFRRTNIISHNHRKFIFHLICTFLVYVCTLTGLLEL